MTALEYMEKQAEKCRRNYDRAMERGATVGELVNIQHKTSYYDEAVEALQKVATDNNVGSKWIPVSERLPNHFGDFVVAVKEGTGHRYSDYASYDPYQQKWRTGLMLGRLDEITHWMPLPEPPKEDA